MDLRVWVVAGDAGCLTALHCAGAQRKPGARNSTRMGTNVHVLLELLAGADLRQRAGALGVGIGLAKTVAGS